MSFRGLILEGVTGTGKTTLFHLLQQRQPFRTAESKLCLAQAFTLRMAPVNDPIDLLRSLLSTIEVLQGRHRASEFARRTDGRGSFFYLLEGFHLYMALDALPFHERRAAVREVEERLGLVGPPLIVALYVPRHRVRELCVERTTRYRGAKWRQFLTRFGETEQQIAEHYSERQSQLFDLLDECVLPAIRINTESQNWDAIADRIEAAATGEEWNIEIGVRSLA